MQLEITVLIRSVYGRGMFYHVCDKAKIFANIANSRTLTEQDIKDIKALGYAVKVQQPVTITEL